MGLVIVKDPINNTNKKRSYSILKSSRAMWQNFEEDMPVVPANVLCQKETILYRVTYGKPVS